MDNTGEFIRVFATRIGNNYVFSMT